MLKILSFLGVMALVLVMNFFLLSYATHKKNTRELSQKLIACYFLFTTFVETYLIYIIIIC